MHIKQILLLSLILLFPHQANAESFDEWLSGFKQRALKEGIASKTINESLASAKVLPRVIELDRKQPEGTMTFTRYKKNIVSDIRIKKGRDMLRKYRSQLMVASKKYNVPPEYIVALWGIETNYGGFTGGTHTLSALATLAYDGRRREFFTKELINALKIIDQGHINAQSMKGSWAGALGQNQFMPSSFLSFAVDGNNDGRKDIWSTKSDVFASSANYLAKSGWKGDQLWGRRIIIPKGVSIDKSLTGTKVKKPLSFWREKGLLKLNGQPVPVVAGMQASLVQPDGPNGETYLAYNNYHVILKWNRSTYFATSVGLLANAIAVAK